jgi:xanthine/uracil permease
MESPVVSGTVIVLILVDLCATVVNDILANTDLINPKYEEHGEHVEKISHYLCVSVLTLFLVEQILHIVAFGTDFFTHFWMVMDLAIVCVSLPCETVFEGMAEDFVGLAIVLRLWKVVAFVFDMFLHHHETSELKEKEAKLAESSAQPYRAL